MKFHEVDIKGYFKLPVESSISAVTHTGASEEGRIFFSIAENTIYYGTDSTFVKIPGANDIFSTYSILLMGYYPLPNHWNVVDYGYARGLRIVNNGSYAGGVGGWWTITGCDTQGSHNHGGVTGPVNPALLDSIGKDDLYSTTSPDYHTHTIQYDGLHTHTFDGAWRPAWVKFVSVRYDR